MKQSMEVIAQFTDGRVIPRRVRYYDIDSASYLEKDITELAYEIIEGNNSTYGVRFSDWDEKILGFCYKEGRWSFKDHL